jgi:hypothetical protein
MISTSLMEPYLLRISMREDLTGGPIRPERHNKRRRAERRALSRTILGRVTRSCVLLPELERGQVDPGRPGVPGLPSRESPVSVFSYW